MLKSLKGSKYIELLSTSNKILLDQWKVHNGVQKEYDEDAKTYIYNIGGKSPVAKICLPKDKKQKLDLHYPLLVLQLYFPCKANILCEVGITSGSGQRKRIILSSNQKSKHSLLFTALPFAIENCNNWVHVLVDVEEIFSAMWKGEKFRGIDSLALSGIFKLKRIFLLSKDLADLTEGAYGIRYDQLPKQMLLSKNILQSVKYISSSNKSSCECLMNTSSETRNISSLKSSRNSSARNLRNERFGGEREHINPSKEHTNPYASSLNEITQQIHFKDFENEFGFSLSTLRFSKETNLEHLNESNFHNLSDEIQDICSDEHTSDTFSSGSSAEKKREFNIPLCYSETS